MKADISAAGILTIRPESGLEAYALACWSMGGARLPAEARYSNELAVYRGSRIIFDTSGFGHVAMEP